MWIIRCTERGADPAHPLHYDVGPFGTDDQAEDAAEQLHTSRSVRTDIRFLVEPARALAGATP